MSTKETAQFTSRRSGGWGFLGGLLAVAGLATAAPAETAIPLDRAPHEWVVYAQKSTQTVTALLNGEAVPGPRLRDSIFAHASQQGSSSRSLLLKLWVSRDGAVTRVETQLLGNDQADKDLRALLLGHRLTPPPRKMLLPMRLMVNLVPPKPGDKK
jgi:hypothetical protein